MAAPGRMTAESAQTWTGAFGTARFCTDVSIHNVTLSLAPTPGEVYFGGAVGFVPILRNEITSSPTLVLMIQHMACSLELGLASDQPGGEEVILEGNLLTLFESLE